MSEYVYLISTRATWLRSLYSVFLNYIPKMTRDIQGVVTSQKRSSEHMSGNFSVKSYRGRKFEGIMFQHIMSGWFHCCMCYNKCSRFPPRAWTRVSAGRWNGARTHSNTPRISFAACCMRCHNSCPTIGVNCIFRGTPRLFVWGWPPAFVVPGAWPHGQSLSCLGHQFRTHLFFCQSGCSVSSRMI